MVDTALYSIWKGSPELPNKGGLDIAFVVKSELKYYCNIELGSFQGYMLHVVGPLDALHGDPPGPPHPADGPLLVGRDDQGTF